MYPAILGKCMIEAATSLLLTCEMSIQHRHKDCLRTADIAIGDTWVRLFDTLTISWRVWEEVGDRTRHKLYSPRTETIAGAVPESPGVQGNSTIPM